MRAHEVKSFVYVLCEHFLILHYLVGRRDDDARLRIGVKYPVGGPCRAWRRVAVYRLRHDVLLRQFRQLFLHYAGIVDVCVYIYILMRNNL